MPYQVTYERKPGYLRVRMEGQESFAEAVRFWHALSDISIAEGFTRFLIVDTVVGQLNSVQHYDVSVIVAQLLRGKLIAYVDPKEETFANNSFGETVVRNRGGLAKVFRSEHDAHQWLMTQMTPQEAQPRK